MNDGKPSTRLRNITAAVSVAAGFCVWAGLSLIGGVREAWDATAYWLIGLPILPAVSGSAGYFLPVRVWRWPVFIGLGQILGMIVINPGRAGGYCH